MWKQFELIARVCSLDVPLLLDNPSYSRATLEGAHLASGFVFQTMASLCVNYGAASNIRSAYMNTLYVLFLYFSYGVNVPLRTSFYSMKWVMNRRLTAFCQLQMLYNLEGYRRQLWCCSWLARCTQSAVAQLERSALGIINIFSRHFYPDTCDEYG